VGEQLAGGLAGARADLQHPAAGAETELADQDPVHLCRVRWPGVLVRQRVPVEPEAAGRPPGRVRGPGVPNVGRLRNLRCAGGPAPAHSLGMRIHSIK